MINRLDSSKIKVMKKTTYIVVLLFLCCQLVLAQKKETRKAHTLFEEKAYYDAAKVYKELKPTQEILQNLGDCYYYNNEMIFAEKPYANLISTYKDSVKPEYYFKYANVLNAINNTKRADEMMTKYRGYAVDTEKFKQHLNSIVPFNYTVKKLSKIRAYNNEVIFAYIVRKKNDDPEKIEFVADADCLNMMP